MDLCRAALRLRHSSCSHPTATLSSEGYRFLPSFAEATNHRRQSHRKKQIPAPSSKSNYYYDVLSSGREAEDSNDIADDATMLNTSKVKSLVTAFDRVTKALNVQKFAPEFLERHIFGPVIQIEPKSHPKPPPPHSQSTQSTSVFLFHFERQK